MPRVVTGRFRGTILYAPKGDKTRPTTDKIKEAIFSMIQGRIYDSSFLDLCSGTGQMGIEAVSRGAKEAVLVDKSAESFAIMKKNLEKIHYDINDKDYCIDVMKENINRALVTLGEKGRKFDIVYIDPPYAKAYDIFMEAVKLICEFDLLRENGILIVEHDKDEKFNQDVMNLKFNRSCTYGITMLTFLSKET